MFPWGPNDRYIAAERNLGVVFEVTCGDKYSKMMRDFVGGKQLGNREKLFDVMMVNVN